MDKGSNISQLEAEVNNSEVQVCEQALSDKEAEYLQVRGSKLGQFYLLPRYIRDCQML